jgi:F-type H+-transporting ATPase subunit epsilon
MASTGTFHCVVVTPERIVLEREATFVAFPAFDGEMGILRNRAPLVAKLGAGELRVESAEGTERLFIDGGFAQMVENRLTILTEQARPIAELDRADAQQELQSALALPAGYEGSQAIRERALRRARTKLRLAPLA